VLVKVVRVRKVLDALGSLIRALRDLKTTILVVALFGRFLQGFRRGCHRGAYHLLPAMRFPMIPTTSPSGLLSMRHVFNKYDLANLQSFSYPLFRCTNFVLLFY
jgi:hypothetical protein